MASFFEDGVDTETKNFVLASWWERHNKGFSLWWLALGRESVELQRHILLVASPDMPVSPQAGKAASSPSASATSSSSTPDSNDSGIKSPAAMFGSDGPHESLTSIILPELSQDGLLASGGQLLILLLARRLVAQDLYFSNDVQALTRIFDEGRLPSLSRNALSSMDTPFVDPMDEDENVRSLGPDVSAESREAIISHLKSGRLIHADVFMALKIRRAALTAFILGLVLKYEEEIAEKPSPTYEALLRGEIQQMQFAMSQEASKTS